MQDRLARHFLAAEATVLGTRLQPFTLWHWRQLAAVDSPLVEDRAAPVLADLVIAVRICSLAPCAPLPDFAPRWRNRAHLALVAHAFRKDFEEHLAAWRAYFSYYLTGPQRLRSEDSSGSGSVKTHPALYLACGLMRAGFPEEKAWATTPGLARWYLAGIAEADGRELLIVSDAMIADALEAGYSMEDIEA